MTQEIRKPTAYLLKQIPYFIQPIKKILFDIIEGNYSILVGDGRANYLSEDDIRSIVSIYPKQISMPSEEDLLNNPCLLLKSKHKLDPKISYFAKEDCCESLWNISILFWDKFDGYKIGGDLEIELEIEVDKNGTEDIKIEQIRIS